MSRTRILIYGAALVLSVTAALAFGRWMNTRFMHDYGHRRAASAEETPIVVLSEEQFADYLEEAIEIRVEEEANGQPKLVFHAGACLLVKRAKEGVPVGPRDRLVTNAVLKLWREPWVQQFTYPKMDEIKTAYFEQLDAGTPPPVETLRAEYVASFVHLPQFEERFRATLDQAAPESRVIIEWTDKGSP